MRKGQRLSRRSARLAGKAEGRRSWREALPTQRRNQRWKPEGEGAFGRQSLAVGYGAVKTAMHRRGGRGRGLERAATGLGVNMGQRLHAPVQQEKRGQTEPEAAQRDLHHDLKFNTCPRLSSPNGAVWRPWRPPRPAGGRKKASGRCCCRNIENRIVTTIGVSFRFFPKCDFATRNH